jgi:outer membrane protein OmpA-like peptidoglycan-associated protein
MVMGLLWASVVLLVTAIFVPRFQSTLLWLSKTPPAPSPTSPFDNRKAVGVVPSPPSAGELPAPVDAKFDVVRIDPERASVFAGRAPAHAQVTVLANGELVATTRADANGQWATVVEHRFAPGECQLSLLTKSNGSDAVTVGGNVRLTIAANARPRSAPSPVSPAAAPRKEAEPPPAPITFTYNEPNFTPAGRQQAAALSEFLNKRKLASVTLSGHADERGSDEFNMELSRQRLEAVAHHLRQSGYAGELKLIPKGKREPYLVPGRERLPREEALQLDRRVELHLKP